MNLVIDISHISTTANLLLMVPKRSLSAILIEWYLILVVKGR